MWVCSSRPFNLPPFEIKHNGRKRREQRYVPIIPRCVRPLFSKRQIKTDHKMPHVVVSSRWTETIFGLGREILLKKGHPSYLPPSPLRYIIIWLNATWGPVCWGDSGSLLWREAAGLDAKGRSRLNTVTNMFDGNFTKTLLYSKTCFLTSQSWCNCMK